MKVCRGRVKPNKRVGMTVPSFTAILLLAAVVGWSNGCSKKPASESAAAPVAPALPPTEIRVSTDANSIAIQTPTAEFNISTAGYVAARLLGNQQKLSLDDPGTDPGDLAVVAGKEIKDFVFDLANAKTATPEGKLGGRGRRVVIQGKSPSTGMEAALSVEVHDDFPNVALVSASFLN